MLLGQNDLDVLKRLHMSECVFRTELAITSPKPYLKMVILIQHVKMMILTHADTSLAFGMQFLINPLVH